MSKFNNRKTAVGTMTFDSEMEARRFQELRLLVRGGFISALTVQPQFLLAPAFTYQGKRERPIYYVADFQYYDERTFEWVVEDAKGAKTAVYKLKRKLFLAKYGGQYRFEEVQA